MKNTKIIVLLVIAVVVSSLITYADSSLQSTVYQDTQITQRNYTQDNSQINERRRPSAEEYRKIRQERGQNSQYNNLSSNTQRRPNAEQYRKMRQQQNRN